VDNYVVQVTFEYQLPVEIIYDTLYNLLGASGLAVGRQTVTIASPRNHLPDVNRALMMLWDELYDLMRVVKSNTPPHW
jgi:hypothetical protein